MAGSKKSVRAQTRSRGAASLLKSRPSLRLSRGLILSLALVVVGIGAVSIYAMSTIAPPRVVSPAAGGVVASGKVALSWTKVAGASSYRAIVTKSTDTKFAAPMFSRTTTATTVTANLPAGSYLWRVRSRDTDGGGPWSVTIAFKVGNGVPSPTPIPSPAPTATPSPSPSPSPGPTGWWKPTATSPTALHWVLGDTLNLNDPVQMGLRDFSGNALPAPAVYDIDGEYNTAATVAALHAQGKKVICYFDAGVYETYRADATKFQALSPRIWGSKDDGWDGSYWLDVRRISELEPIMKARMQMCKSKGFDAIEPDEIDGWENKSGFPLTYQDQLTYNKALSRWAHDLGMSIGQKGDLIQVRDLVGDFDWTLNEECYQYNECTSVYDPVLKKNVSGLQLYVQANKAVFIAEYKNYDATKWSSVCSNSASNHFNTTLFKLGLPNNGGRKPCSTSGSW